MSLFFRLGLLISGQLGVNLIQNVVLIISKPVTFVAHNYDLAFLPTVAGAAVESFKVFGQDYLFLR